MGVSINPIERREHPEFGTITAALASDAELAWSYSTWQAVVHDLMLDADGFSPEFGEMHVDVLERALTERGHEIGQYRRDDLAALISDTRDRGLTMIGWA